MIKVEGPHHVVCQCDKCKAQEQEPVAYCYVKKTSSADALTFNPDPANAVDNTVFPLYALPPQRPWQGLTDEHIDELMNNYDVASLDYARAIEAKLKHKNT